MKFNKKIIIAIFILIILILTILVVLFFNTRTIDVSQATHAVTVEDGVIFYKKDKLEDVKIYKTLDIGSKVYVLENFEGDDGISCSKVVIDNKVGYILSEKLGTYETSDDEKVLMVDVSKFNQIYNFETAGEFSAFLVSNDISYVYIRAGGRGYGDEGNFYYDELATTWADECEFLQIPFGFYFLDEALDSDEIDEEVKFIKEFLEDNSYEYAILPVALDVEKHNGIGRADDIWDTRAILVSELIQDLENEEISSIVYSNANVANEYLSEIDTNFWIAYYPSLDGKIPDYWYSDTDQDGAQNETLMEKVIAWQFTESRSRRCS